MRILVLGAGRMGLGAAYDLVHSEGVKGVTIADVEAENLKNVAVTLNNDKLIMRQVNVGDYGQALELMRGHDAAISCVNYWHNEQLAKAALETGVNFCDLGGNNDVVAAELALDEAAQAANINIIPDCGLAPGMVAVLAAHAAERFEQLEAIHIRVGGLPQQPEPPLNYQIVFSVEGLINEYIEPSRVVRGGQTVAVESLTEVELLDFPPFGQLEAFHTSGGISTLPESFAGRAQEMDYKTIRYPGHCAQFKLLADLGLCGSGLIKVDGISVKPRRVLGALLYQQLPKDGPDLVLIRVEVCGTRAGKRQTLRYEIVDSFDEQTGLSAMMRTTAFPASIIAQMMARGETTRKGSQPQERCVPPDPFVKELAKRNIVIKESWF